MGNLERFVTQMLGAEITGKKTWRTEVFNDKVGENVIDTCYAPDTGHWETGIQRKEEPWVIVQKYRDRDEAKDGHILWVKKLSDDNNADLPSCQDAEDWFFGDDASEDVD